MATVYVMGASIDENGKAHGGKAGNQTGRELRKQAWYKHSKGWRVFRAKNGGVAAKIAQCMRAAVANKHIGYDQWQRNSLYNEAEKYGFDVSKVTKDVETDCSALVRVCCAYAGITGIPASFRTHNEPSTLLGTGAFVEMKGAKYTDQSAYLREGDILCTASSGHTVVVVNNGSKAETAPEPAPAPSVQQVLITGGSVNVRSAPGTTNTRVLGVVHKDDRLPYQGQKNAVGGRDWYLVEYKGQNAWVSSKYAKVV